jgi:hypothetical protein
MAEERDDEQFSEKETSSSGQQSPTQQGKTSPQSEFGQQGAKQGSEGSFGGQSSGSEGVSGMASEGGGMGGQPIGGNDSNTGSGTTLTQGAEFGRQSSSDRTQSSSGETGGGLGTGGSAGGTTGEGFILQQGSGTDASSAEATEGEDFAPEGRGALEGEEEDIEGNQTRGSPSDIEQP